jgi:SAM-dependent methyltransferase
MLSWLHSHFPPPSSSLSSSSSSPSILDVGSGNGHFLHILAGKKGGYDGRKMVGVDYSEGSVSLSQLIGRDLGEGRRPEGWKDSDDSESEEEDEEDAGGKGTEGEVRFEWGDVLSDVGLTEIEVPLGEEGWDVVTDKGKLLPIVLMTEIAS